jgi:hypothetical protein
MMAMSVAGGGIFEMLRSWIKNEIILNVFTLIVQLCSSWMPLAETNIAIMICSIKL